MLLAHRWRLLSTFQDTLKPSAANPLAAYKRTVTLPKAVQPSIITLGEVPEEYVCQDGMTYLIELWKMCL